MGHAVQKDTEIDYQILSYDIMGRQRGNSKRWEGFQGKFRLQYQRETTREVTEESEPIELKTISSCTS